MPNLTSMSAAVGALLKERQQTVSVTESSCGGLISASLVAVPGCSAFYVGGATIYTRTAQYGLLHVAESAFEGIESSTEPYALMNSRNVRAALGTTWALSETGASGPTGGSHGNDPGHSCMAVVGPVERSITVETRESRSITVETRVADREANMWMFAKAALELLEKCIRESA